MIFLTFNCDCALLAAFETFYEKHLIIIIIIIIITGGLRRVNG